MNIQFLGILAGCLTAFSALPQLIKTYQTRDAKDLSAGMLLGLICGLCLWVWYGIERKDIPIIATNGLAALFNASLLSMKIYFKDLK